MTTRIDASVSVLILEIRGQRVMLDADLAALYRVSTKALVQAVKRNVDRFPAFSERGVAMLSSVLRSPPAIAVNITIMRAFVRLRQLAAANGELAKRLEELSGGKKRGPSLIRLGFRFTRKSPPG